MGKVRTGPLVKLGQNNVQVYKFTLVHLFPVLGGLFLFYCNYVIKDHHVP